MISTVFRYLCDLLSLKNDVPEFRNHRIRMFMGLPDQHPDPLVRGTDPRIRIRTKTMPRIRNTGFPCGMHELQCWNNWWTVKYGRRAPDFLQYCYVNLQVLARVKINISWRYFLRETGVVTWKWGRWAKEIKKAFYQIVDTSSLEEDPLQDTLSGNPMTDVSQVLDPVVHLPTLQHLKV